MSGEDAFTVEGLVTEVLSERTCRVKLANGHVLFGFIPGRKRVSVRLTKGLMVTVRLSPYDLSGGRILLATN